VILRYAVLALAALALCLGAAAVGAQETHRVVAVVGDEIVTSLDVDRMVRTMKAQMGPPGAAAKQGITEEQMRKVALDRLIEDRLFAQEVERLGIAVSEADVDRYLARIKANNDVSDQEFAAQLSRRGITPEEYRQGLKKDMLKHRLITREVKNTVVITDEQVAEYYKKSSDQFQQQGQVRIRALFLALPQEAGSAVKDALRQRARDLREEAESKGNLAELAGKYSQGPGADKGGELGPLAAKDLLPEMRQALGELKAGQLSPVIEIPSGFVFFELLGDSGDQVLPMGEAAEQIRQKLESEALEKRFQEWMDELKKRTFVKVVN